MFQKATKEALKAKISIEGPSGSGKTYSALKLASGMGKRIGVIDTENKSIPDICSEIVSSSTYAEILTNLYNY